ncbi:hypothetical protein AB0I35_06030 [Nocardia sp. NPDC050378]|uniref:hypothetical protein n=1 Tax=Nocardia sp. NPDC050378 TaxID=3155400 RepID=UPI0033F8C2AA
MNHAEHDETIGSMLANIAAALREVSEKLDVVAARVAQEVPRFPGDDEDVPDQLRIRRLEAWAFHASQDISRLSARLDALDGGDDPAPPPARGRSRREVREAAERAAAHEEATRPPLERRQSSRSVPDHLGDPTWPITAAPVPRAPIEPQSGVVAGERSRAASHEEDGPRTAAFAVQSSGLGDPEPQAARASSGGHGDTAQRAKVNGAHAPQAPVSEAVSNAQRVNGRLPAQPERETPARGVADDIAAQGVGLTANRAVALPDSTGGVRHDEETVTGSDGSAGVERARPVGKVPTETRGTERHTTSGNVTWSPNGVDPQAQRNGSGPHRATDLRPSVEHAGGSEDTRHSSFDADTAGERVGDSGDAHRTTRASGHGDDQRASSARGPGNGTGGPASTGAQDRVGIIPAEDAHAIEARVATNGTTFNGFADRTGSGPKNGSTNGIQWSFDDDVETTLPTPPRNGHARNGFTTDSRGESVFADFTPRNSTTTEKPAAPARLVAPPAADSAHQVEAGYVPGRATAPSEHLDQAPRSGPSVGGPDYRTSPATESVDRSGDTALPTDYPNQAGHSAQAAGDPGRTHQSADRITQGEQSSPSDEAANNRFDSGERSSRPHGHSAEETGRPFGQDAHTGPLAAQAAHGTARFTNSDNEAGTRHGRPAAPAVDLPAVHASSSADDNLGPAPIPTATDPAGITVTGTYRAFDLESAAHVDKLQAMLDELKRSAGLPPGRRDVFGPPTQDLG